MNENDSSDDSENNSYASYVYEPAKPIGISYSYSKTNFTEKKEDCGICLENSNELIETNCKHIFHLECLNKWFSHSENCPTCRKEFSFDEFLMEHEFENFFEKDDYNLIESLKVNRENIWYECDLCDKRIESETRYHKNGKNYDLCEECYKKEDTNIILNEYSIITSDFFSWKNKRIPKKIKSFGLYGDFELIDLNIKSLNLLELTSSNITNSEFESNKIILEKATIINSKFHGYDELSINDTTIDHSSFESIISNIKNQTKIFDIFVNIKDELKTNYET
jgi:hypothetical protein